jgi:CRISPR-associated endonuclease/helicase Cas3
MTFETFFRLATGKPPFPFQTDFACAPELPQLLEAPTGAGKTATAILGWLWRRRYASPEVRRATPRRLVYCLPMRVLVEQTVTSATGWLANLCLTTDVRVHVLMGGEESEEWDLAPEHDAILIGTQDMLISRALNRGYGMSRYRWPMHFALLNNDCLWVFDEIQLMGNGLATSAQIAAFRQILGCLGAAHCLWMSATIREEWLKTVDSAQAIQCPRQLQLAPADRTDPRLSKRLQAPKAIRKAPIPIYEGQEKQRKPRKKPDVAADTAKLICDTCKRDHLLLAVFNTVEQAYGVFQQVKAIFQPKPKTSRRKPTAADSQTPAPSPDLVLLHSRFRPPERQALIEKVLSTAPPEGRIVISTQVVEAGVDLSAHTLVTELAPWPSLVQRFGRCNRYGEHADAQILWIDVPTEQKGAALPYRNEDLDAARAVLQKPDFTNASIESLETLQASLSPAEQKRLFPYEPTHVIRRKDIVELFDTTPDLAGNDIDVSRFIRDADEHDVFVFWRGDVPPPEGRSAPIRQELCPVPVGKFRDFLNKAVKGKKPKTWHWDFLERRWTVSPPRETHPGGIYLLRCQDGGYSKELGWDGETRPVEQVPLPPDERSADANDADEPSKGDWKLLCDHTDDLVRELDNLLKVLDLPLAPNQVQALLDASRWHDRGKAHKVYQSALPADDARRGPIWAKAPEIQRYSRPGFRHELASALAMLQEGLPDLACYLAAAHHGKVRLSIRSLPHEEPRGDGRRFARGVQEGDGLPQTGLGSGVVAPAVTLSLEPMELGTSSNGQPSWAERMLKLRDAADLGPFRLAFLEALLRAADIRASRNPRKEEPHA